MSIQLLSRIAMNVTSDSSSPNAFGPASTQGFDFSLLFQDTIFSIVLSIILLIVLPIRILWLHRQPRKVIKSGLHDNKLFFFFVYAAMRLALLILWAHSDATRSYATIPALSLAFVDAILLCALSHLEHIRSVRPSPVINAYLFLTLLFDIVRCRTVWIQPSSYDQTIAGLMSSVVGVKVLILVSEAYEKRDILLEQYQETSPEVTSGLYSRSFFWWLNELMQTGFKRVLTDKDLYPIEPEMSSLELERRAQASWQAVRRNKGASLFLSTLRSVQGFILYCVFPRLCMIGFRYAQPLLLNRTVKFANDENEPDRIGWGLTAAFVVVFVGLAVSKGSYYHMSYRMVVATRGALVGPIYRKTVDLSITALDESAAVTLMSSDVETICLGVANLHEIWAVPIECGIAFYLLQRQLGVAFLAPAGVASLAISGIFILARYIGNAQKTWVEGIQSRIDVTANMLGRMKAVKMLGFSDKLNQLIQSLRLRELQLSLIFRRLLVIRVLLANSMGLLAPLVTFGLFVAAASRSGQTLQTSSAYTALSLIALLADPVNTLTRTIPMLKGALACSGRISDFLQNEARKDVRITPNPNSSILIDEAETDIELSVISPKKADNIDITKSSSVLIKVRGASFGWKIGSPPIVRNLDFDIREGTLNFVIGPVGSGKSSLLKGLLGELPSSEGHLSVSTSTMAYVDQSPWIQNRSIKDNILGVSTFNREWYDTVVHACALAQDIAQMPKGDSTCVGSSGMSLSGGQKQRLALARAVYSREKLLLLDDVLSGLDATTEETIFARLFGSGGLLRHTMITVVLVTHAIQRLAHADYVIVLEASGTICEQGTFQSLQRNGTYINQFVIGNKLPDEIQPAGSTPPAKQVLETQTIEVEEPPAGEDHKTSELATYGYYFGSIGWPAMSLFIILCIITGVCSKMTELILTYWTEAINREGNSVNALYFGIYASLAGFSFIIFSGNVYFYLTYVVPRSAQVLHARLLETVMAAPLSFFTSTDTGTTTNRFSQDMTVIDAELPFAFIDLSLQIVALLMGSVLMCLSAGVFSAVMPPVILALWVLQRYYLRTSKQLRVMDIEAKSPLYSNFIETLSGLTTIRAFGWSEAFQDTNHRLLVKARSLTTCFSVYNGGCP